MWCPCVHKETMVNLAPDNKVNSNVPLLTLGLSLYAEKTNITEHRLKKEGEKGSSPGASWLVKIPPKQSFLQLRFC